MGIEIRTYKYVNRQRKTISTTIGIVQETGPRDSRTGSGGGAAGRRWIPGVFPGIIAPDDIHDATVASLAQQAAGEHAAIAALAVHGHGPARLQPGKLRAQPIERAELCILQVTRLPLRLPAHVEHLHCAGFELRAQLLHGDLGHRFHGKSGSPPWLDPATKIAPLTVDADACKPNAGC